MEEPVRPTGWRPGDGLLDRYLPDADEETRERARETFREFAFFLLRVGERIQAEQPCKAESSNSDYGLAHPLDEEDDEIDYYGA